MHSHTCTHTHILKHTYTHKTHALTHSYTDKHVHSHTCTYTCVPSHTHMCPHTHVPTQSRRIFVWINFPNLARELALAQHQSSLLPSSVTHQGRGGGGKRGSVGGLCTGRVLEGGSHTRGQLQKWGFGRGRGSGRNRWRYLTLDIELGSAGSHPTPEPMMWVVEPKSYMGGGRSREQGS